MIQPTLFLLGVSSILFVISLFLLGREIGKMKTWIYYKITGDEKYSVFFAWFMITACSGITAIVAAVLIGTNVVS